jgi:hypothetical protein
MRHFSTIIGSAICGALVFAIWPEMWKSYGIMGGWLAATILISIAWYMNHWLGVIDNPCGKIWVDQGFAVCSAGIAWAIVRFDAVPLRCLPTLICLAIGGALAGWAAVHVKKVLPRFAPAPPDPTTRTTQHATRNTQPVQATQQEAD